MKENKKFECITFDEIVKQLEDIGLKKGQHIFVHTSLKSLGFVVGGAEILIRALLEVVGEEGTIMMPSQTWKNLDPTIGVHWEVPESHWDIIRENWPSYDKEITPAIGMGVVAEMFRKWPGAHRSNHPARSVAAVGKHAKYLTENHDLSNIFGEDSPVDKLYKLNGHVLLIGVNHDKNTSIHLAETRANFKSKAFTTESSAILVDGKREWVSYKTQAVDDEDFLELGAQYEKDSKMPVFNIGKAEVRFFKQAPFVDWAVKWIEINRK